MDEELKNILIDLKDKNTVTISYIQRTFSFGFIKSNKIFNQLIEEQYISPTGEVNKKKVYEALGEKYRPGAKIIFLDVDGVLNCRTTKDRVDIYPGIDDDKVALLKKIVVATKAKIVLTSTWKYQWYRSKDLKDKQDGFANRLDESFALKGLHIVSKTHDEGLNRGEGILEYLRRLKLKGIKVDGIVILDDEMFDYKYTKLTKYLVQTSYNDGGLQEKHVKKAIEKLGLPYEISVPRF